jgi:hypothetical protein
MNIIFLILLTLISLAISLFGAFVLICFIPEIEELVKKVRSIFK